MDVSIDAMFLLATAAFGWGLALATYRWFALPNGWSMGAWQANLPVLPRAIGIAAMVVATAIAVDRGVGTALLVPLLGLLVAVAWTVILKVGAQSALLLAPLAAAVVLVCWRIGGA